jgi:hypothetical protein
MGVANAALLPVGRRCDKGRIRQRCKAPVIYALMLIPSPTNKADDPRICRALASAYMRVADMRAATQLERGRMHELNAQNSGDMKADLKSVADDLMTVLRWLGR